MRWEGKGSEGKGIRSEEEIKFFQGKGQKGDK